MNIRRIIDKNRKLIWYTIIIIVFAFIVIRALNSYYEKDEKKKALENKEIQNNISTSANVQDTNVNYGNSTIESTMKTFVNYCNSKQIKKAYQMLTEDCKKSMFPTVQDFENVYINIVYNVERDYELLKWSAEKNNTTYIVKLYENALATGSIDNFTEEYYTFVKKDDGTYEINVNNYIFGEDKNIEKEIKNIKIKIGHVDIYEEYECAEITISNNTSKTISLTGNKYMKNIYLKNAKGTAYSSFNTEFDSEEIIMKPNSVSSFSVKFNKVYDSVNKAKYLVLSDVIMDYDEYANSEDKVNYSNRTSIEIEY